MPIKRVEIPIEGDFEDFLTSLSDELASPALFNDVRPYFKGSIEKHHFKIWRNYLLRGCEPIIRGKHLKDSEGSRLLLFIHVNIIGLIIFLGIYIYALYYSFEHGFDAILTGALILLPLVAIYQFYSESTEVIKRIRKILKISSSANKRLE